MLALIIIHIKKNKGSSFFWTQGYPVNQITSTKRRFHVTFVPLTWIYRRILSCLTSYRRGIALFVALLQRRTRKRCIAVVLNVVITSFLKFSDL